MLRSHYVHHVTFAPVKRLGGPGVFAVLAAGVAAETSANPEAGETLLRVATEKIDDAKLEALTAMERENG